MSDRETCEHVKDDGERCGVTFGLSDAGLCLHHDPERAEIARRARSDGGRTTAEKRRKSPKAVPPEDTPGELETLQDAVRWAAWAARAVATGDLDTSRGNTVAKLLKEFRAALEKHESRETLEEIRRKVEELAGGDAAPDLEAMP